MATRRGFLCHFPVPSFRPVSFSQYLSLVLPIPPRRRGRLPPPSRQLRRRAGGLPPPAPPGRAFSCFSLPPPRLFSRTGSNCRTAAYSIAQLVREVRTYAESQCEDLGRDGGKATCPSRNSGTACQTASVPRNRCREPGDPGRQGERQNRRDPAPPRTADVADSRRAKPVFAGHHGRIRYGVTARRACRRFHLCP